MTGRVKKEVSRERERRAWELRQQCWTEERIAAELGVTQSAVSQILARVSARVIGNLDDDVERVKREQTAQYFYIIDEAMQAWERSKEAKKKLSERTGNDGTVTTKEIADQDGDPRYLDVVNKALEAIRKIWGANAAEQKDVTSAGQPLKGYTILANPAMWDIDTPESEADNDNGSTGAAEAPSGGSTGA